MSKPIPPTIKAYLDEALPANEGGHVLALGEYHSQTSNSLFLKDTLQELKRAHNLGALGVEKNSFYNVFHWAYQDGCLPGGRAFMTNIYPLGWGYGGAEENAKTVAKALDRGIDVVAFDSRKTLDDMKRLPVTKALQEVLEAHPSLRTEVRGNPKSLMRIAAQHPALSSYARGGAGAFDALMIGFVTLEAEALIKQHPEYRERLKKMDAVIEAGMAAGMGTDAISAALLTHAVHPEKNTITISGLTHLMGQDEPDPKPVQDELESFLQTEGTLAHHLRSILGIKNVRSALLTSEQEAKDVILPDFLERGTNYKRLHRAHRSFYVPDVIVSDKDQIVTNADLPRVQQPGTIGEALAAAKTAYDRNTQPSNAIQVAEAAYVGRMEDLIKQNPAMVAALDALRTSFGR